MSTQSPGLCTLRTLLCAVLLWALAAPALAQGPADPEPEEAHLQLVLFGPGSKALSAVRVDLNGLTRETDTDGTLALSTNPGHYTLRLSIPKAELPEAPAKGDLWVVDLSDIPLVQGETTVVIATIGASGGIAGLDIQAPEAGGGARSMEREYAEKLKEKPSGTIKGLLRAAEDAKRVAGARIYVRGAPVEAVSDDDGQFAITLPEGTYQLSIVHSKYSTQSVPDVVVTSGEETPITVDLSPASVELDELVVTAPHIEGGIATLVAERRESTAVADVIGAEQMSRQGSTTAAAALLRVTGLTIVDGKFVIVRGMAERYSNMLVNNQLVPSPEPTRRVVPLDLFPAGILDSVVVQKTFSPDSQGEFGGGMVQLRTRNYPEKLTVNLNVTGGYNTETTFLRNRTYDGGQRDYLGVDDGARRLPSAIPGDQVKSKDAFGGGYTTDEIRKMGSSFKANYQTHRERTLPNLSLMGSVGNLYKLRRAKIGFIGAAGYKSQINAFNDQIVRILADSGKKIYKDYKQDQLRRLIGVSGFLDWGVEFSPEHKLKFTSMLLRQTDDSTYYRTGYDDDLGTSIRRTRLGWIERQVFDQQVSGTHKFTKAHDFEVDWRYSYAKSKRKEPDRRDNQYNLDKVSNQYLVSPSPGDNVRVFGDLNDDTHQGAIDFIQPFQIWSGLKAKAKAGGMVFWRKRRSSVRRFDFQPISVDDPGGPLNLVLAQPNVLDGSVTFTESTKPTDSYTGEMRIDAGYGMVEMSLLKQLDLMAGARVEHAVISVTTFDPYSSKDPIESNLPNTDILPAVTLTYRFAEDFQLRAGYGKTLNRPDLRELSESNYIDVETAAYYFGNKDLQRAVIHNVDTRLEWYYSSDETLSIGGFYKRINSPIEQVIQPFPGSGASYTWDNSDDAYVLGLEFEARKRFDFISPKADPFYIATNLSLIKSKVDFSYQKSSDGPVEHGTRPLQAQSPWVVNVQLGYDDDVEGGSGTSVSLLYNIFGTRLRAVGDRTFDIPDQYEKPFNQLDLVFSQRLPHSLQLGFRVQNILNATQRWTQGDYVVRRYKPGTTAWLSLAWSY